jgi:hypothetical protein
MGWITDWFTWGNALYLLVLVLGGILTVISAKWRKVFKEVKEVAEALQEAYEDKKLTNAERKIIMKEALDVLKALIAIKWKFGK